MIVIALIFICVLVFIFENNWVLQTFGYVPALTLSEPWRLITSMFLHADISHLLFNMLALFLFGVYLERKVGSKWFLIIYFLSGIIGSLGFAMFSSPDSIAIGASSRHNRWVYNCKDIQLFENA
jgi:membrane associated rhomboid family serine protease